MKWRSGIASVMFGLVAASVASAQTGPLFNVQFNSTGYIYYDELQVLTTIPGKTYQSASITQLSPGYTLICPSNLVAPCLFSVSNTTPAFIRVDYPFNLFTPNKGAFIDIPIKVRLCLNGNDGGINCEMHNVTRTTNPA